MTTLAEIHTIEPTGLADVVAAARYQNWDLQLCAPLVKGPPWVPWTVHATPPGGTCCGHRSWIFAVPSSWHYATPPVGQFWNAWLRQCLRTVALHMVDHQLDVGGALPFDPGRVPAITESC